MDINDLKQYPLASLYGWRSPLFLGEQGATPEAAERRAIREQVAREMAATRRRAAEAADREDLDDLI